MEYERSALDGQLASFAQNHVDPDSLRFVDFVRNWSSFAEKEITSLRDRVDDLVSHPDSSDLKGVRLVYQKVLDALPLPAVLVGQNGDLLLHNSHWLRFFAITEEHLESIRNTGLISWLNERFDPKGALQDLHNHAQDQVRMRSQSLTVLKDGAECYLHWTPVAVEDHTEFLWIFENQGELRRVQRRLKESEERFQLAAQGANDGLWDWHLKTNELYFSPRWLNMLGYSEKDFHNSLADWLNLVHPADKRELSIRLHEHLTKRNSRFRHEYRIQDKTGDYRWVLAQGMLILDENGDPYRFAGSQTDITEMKRMERQLIHDSTHDLLTNLPNRLLFREELGKLMQRSFERANLSFAIIQLNLDQFQLINNGLGHLFGDQVLMIVAGRLLSLVEEADTVARLAGDEFAVLLASAQTSESVAQFAAKIIATLAEPVNVHGQEIVLTAGLGIVIRNPQHSNVGQLLGDAATAMHHAKAMGVSNWVLFSEEMRVHAITRIQLESKLRRAIEQHEIQVFFQPIVSAETHQVCSLEALVRWFDPEKGLISPASFIPLAEETSLILPLGEFVLRKACQEAIKWHAMGFTDLTVAVNLSPKQFQQPNLHERIAQIMEETGMPRNKLDLEITESQVMENPQHAIEILKRLRDLGISISIDDFGTGYSSLAYLKRFPINTLKIDRSFVEGLPVEHDDTEISRAIIALAHSLKLDLIAEGVETEAQAEFLRQEGCNLLQGFLFAKPMPATDVPAWLLNYQMHLLHPATGT
ncbi:MAG TPA: EAL domain-containing protein [Fibrobacteraceae bacterium]|nr:EAL domain-containing protein [Fibrobacteraceae bacterium]